MQYSLLQKNLESPDVDKLKRAFRQVPGFVEVDAHALANDFLGVLVKHQSQTAALMLQKAFRAEGMDTEIVDESRLIPIPSPKVVKRVECRTEGFVVYDALERPINIPWNSIVMVAAGNISHGEADRGEVIAELMLEIIVGRAETRYSIKADSSSVYLFQYLGARRTRNIWDNFTMLVQDICKHAKFAATNSGAYYLKENTGEVFSYPTKAAFMEEMTWLLWQMASQSKKK